MSHCKRIVYVENIERSSETAQWNWWNLNYRYKFTYLPKAGAYEQHEMWKITKHLKFVRCTIFLATTMAMQFDFTCYLWCRLEFYTESMHWRIVFTLSNKNRKCINPGTRRLANGVWKQTATNRVVINSDCHIYAIFMFATLCVVVIDICTLPLHK